MKMTQSVGGFKASDLKLAYVVTGFPTFSETFIQREVAELLRRGVSLDVYSLRPRDRSDHVNVREPLWEGHCFYVPTHPLKPEVLSAVASYGWRGLAVLRRILKQIESRREALKILVHYPRILWLAKRIEKQGYSRIHAHWATLPATAAYVVQQLAGIPYSITAHAYDIYTSREGAFLKEKLRAATHVVTCTRYNLDYLRRLVQDRASRFKLVYHGLNPDDYDPTVPYPERSYILAGGRLVAKKGFHVLLQALHQVKVTRGGEIPTVIFGDGPERERLESERASLGLQAVTFVGRQPHAEVQKLMAKARVFVAPSVITADGNMDGIPNVLVESMASGVPAVASAISGIPEVIVPGETGWLVKAGDVLELAACLTEAWEHPEVCQKFGQRARNVVEEKFDLAKNMSQLLELFESAVTEDRGGRLRASAGELESGLQQGGAAGTHRQPPRS